MWLPQRSARVLAILVGALAVSMWPGWSLNPEVLDNLPIHTWGPYNTALNHGYESENRVSPVIPTSYQAARGPHVVGVQFIGDAQVDLKHDHFGIKITGTHMRTPFHVPNVYHAGFVGWRLSKRLAPGRYNVTFDFPGFDIAPQSWTISVTNRRVPPARLSSSASLILKSLNTVRSALNLDPVHWSDALQLASMAHVQYLAQNGYNAPSFHMESPGRPGYVGRTPWNRDMAFGWPSPLAGEVGIEWAIPSEAVTIVQDLVDTVYHRLSILSDNLLAMGVAETSGPHGAVVMDLGFGYRANLPKAIVYPYDGQPGVPTAWVDIESPNPVREGYGHIFGYPITADFPTVAHLNGVRLWLAQDRHRVPVVIDAPGTNGMQSNQIGMVPMRPLRGNSVYVAHLVGRATFDDGMDRPIRLTWRFATGGQNQSLAATVESPVTVVIADMTAGSGVTIGGEPITLYRRQGRQPLKVVARGRTNWDGLWTLTLAHHQAGEYEAVSATNNATVFWWGDHG